MRELQQRLLERAVQIAGSDANLAARLSVDEHTVWFWRTERARLPDRLFHALVDMILDDDLARAASDRRTQPRTRHHKLQANRPLWSKT